VQSPLSDQEMLDWLEAHLFEPHQKPGRPCPYYTMTGNHKQMLNHMNGNSLREAIANAMWVHG